MATAASERASYELDREKRLGLVACAPAAPYDLIVEDRSTGEQSIGRYVGTIMPSHPAACRPIPYTGSYTDLTTEYPSLEIDGYDRGPRGRPGSALPISASLLRPAGPPNPYSCDPSTFRPVSPPDYRAVSRPKSAMASLGGALGEAAGRKYDALPVYHSQAFRVQEDIPVEQYYELTQLRKSNLRNDDQLLPRPEACEISKMAVNRPFPAAHPLSSHTVEKAVFPKFAETPDDSRTGAEAKWFIPKSPNVPNNPADVIVVKKTKGHGERHEIHHLPAGDTMKRPLHWPGEHGFDQQVKAHGGKQQYYPAPTKTYVPNPEVRPPHMQISERTANALVNVERDQWTTTYDRNNTGYGPVHAMALDNFDDKVRKFKTSGDIDDKLYPRSVPVFDPARPVEGRIARALTPRPPPQVPESDWRARPHDEPRKMTDKELEEIRLLYGREYVNLPEGKALDTIYTDGKPYQERVDTVELVNQNGTAEEEDEQNELDQLTDDLKINQKMQIQQMEAENRWRDLQASKPHHDLEALKVKYQKLQGKEHVNVFYDHEGRYQEERAGVYKTDYIPEKLAASMNTDNARDMFDTSRSHVDALNHPSRLNVEMDAIRAYSGIRHRDLANNTGRVFPSQVLEPEFMKRYQQKLRLQPNAMTSRGEVQEDGFIGRDSEYQDHYNHEKFLQDHRIHPLARSEPNIVMSTENQRLNNVRDFSMKRSKTVHFSNDITVATGAGSEPIRISSAPMNGADDGEEYRRRIEEGMRLKEHELQRQAYLDGQTLNDNQASSSHAMYRPTIEQPKLQRSVSFERLMTRPSRGSYKNFVDDQFASQSSNFAPSGVKQDNKSSYESQFPTSYSLDFKNDGRFHWRPGMGRPRPRSQLMDIQDGFSKTTIMREFNRKFPELHADIRAHVMTGRRHTFDGVHAQTFRGN